ncbi:MAG: ATP-binding protein, partial [Burkholderiales bacterium]
TGPVATPGHAGGAGLLVARAVIERFGGSVQKLPGENGGNCVRIELPLSSSNQEKNDGYREPRIAPG